jgi:hypothetical protein
MFQPHANIYLEGDKKNFLNEILATTRPGFFSGCTPRFLFASSFFVLYFVLARRLDDYSISMLASSSA